MNVTPLAFLESMEKLSGDFLRANTASAWVWTFNRFLAFHDASGSVQVMVGEPHGEPRLAGVLHVRQVTDATVSVWRGWTRYDGMAVPTPFVFHIRADDSVESSAGQLAEQWSSDLIRA